MSSQEIFEEAKKQGLGLISITDHDSLESQEEAVFLSEKYNIKYLTGLELSVAFSNPRYLDSKPISLDFLAYDYDIRYDPLIRKLSQLREYRVYRAGQILEKINAEFDKKGIERFTNKDLEEIQISVDGAFGRPHIAAYLVKKGIVGNKQEAFDIYLVRCNVPKMPLTLAEASELVRGAGGKLILAHPNHPRGTSLIKFTDNLAEQQKIIRKNMLEYIDGVECWHSEHDKKTTESYLSFAENQNLLVSGGSDCHQNPVIIGTVDIPSSIAEQFGIKLV